MMLSKFHLTHYITSARNTWSNHGLLCGGLAQDHNLVNRRGSGPTCAVNRQNTAKLVWVWYDKIVVITIEESKAIVMMRGKLFCLERIWKCKTYYVCQNEIQLYFSRKKMIETLQK